MRRDIGTTLYCFVSCIGLVAVWPRLPGSSITLKFVYIALDVFCVSCVSSAAWTPHDHHQLISQLTSQDIHPLLGQRRRHWLNIDPPMGEWSVLAGMLLGDSCKRGKSKQNVTSVTVKCNVRYGSFRHVVFCPRENGVFAV